MSRHRNTRRAVLLLMVLAVAFMWAADPGLRAAGQNRDEKSATPATNADKAVTGTTVKDPPATTTAKSATPAKADTTAAKTTAVAGVTAAEPQNATAAKGKGQVTRDQAYVQKFKKIAPSVQREAAKQARLRGLKPGVAGLAKIGIAAAALPLPGSEGPGGIPHYFGPYANWAFSPAPRGPVTAVTILAGGTGYTNPIIVIDDAYGTGTSIAIPTTATLGAVQPPAAGPYGADFTAPVATVIDDPASCGGASPQPPCGTGALADAVIGGTLTGGMRKFVDGLPLLGLGGANNLGQYIPVATPDTATYLGSDYYEIALVEYTEQMHSDLPATRLRGYVQLATTVVPGATPLMQVDGVTPVTKPDGSAAIGVDKPHFLGPLILAQGRVVGAGIEARPVRIKFYNLLRAGAGGNLLLPVDKTVPGSGVGPASPAEYTQNRATIHLHGNNTVWISDGNTHQWITPANEVTPYPAGVSARNVPDMGTGCDAVAGTGLPGNPATSKSSGCMTFYYTNAQSARLQFYHDHAMGITRLNVYAGEAAGYVITDAVEQDMINGTNVSGVNPGLLKVLPDLGIPLVIQDKTWVDPDTIYAQDPTWAWGSAPLGTAVKGDFWYPHVYMTVTNPYDSTGTNPFGRWFYGPWFNPPTPVCSGGLPLGCIDVGLVSNPYYDPLNAPWEPPVRPGTPNPSIPGESFMDTPIVNGTAYPVLTVEPKAYRFRILSAANDRTQNLQLYVAADKTGPTTAGTDYVATPARLCDGTVAVANCTEVKMVPVSVLPANQFADTPSGIPDPTTAGPPWIQIGTEGGFMPAPVVVPQQPIGFNMNTGQFNFSIVNQHSLYLMPAERADVVVDFSAYAGKTLILYNDSPAPVPAGAAVYDFYTGDGNQMDGGGAPNTLPGYGPNTRTIMQIQVGTTVTTPTTDVTLANLQAVFAKTAAKRGVFEVSQDAILIPQAAYNSAYNLTFPSDASQFVLSPGDAAKTFQPLGYNSVTRAWSLQPAVTFDFEFKAMHDEMGGVYDTGFGRMSGMLGLTNPSVPGMIPFPFGAPPTDVVRGSLEATPIGQLADGTQLWRIFHNGVDTHPIHTHLFTAQVISRVGQDGQVASGALAVDPGDLGWKDTFKVNPLEITFLALRPTVPTPSQVPFDLPNSVRLIDPTLPAGVPLPAPGPAGWFDPLGNPIDPLLNHTVNFGWEYVWHCHILSHEEMDFMHSLVFAMPPKAPGSLIATRAPGNKPAVNLTWADNSIGEVQFRIERATNADFITGGVTTFTTAANVTSFQDKTVPNNRWLYYRVWAVGAVVGDTTIPNFPTMAAESVSNSATVLVGTVGTLTAPTTLTATGQPGPQVALGWTDNATNETGFQVWRCPGTCIATGSFTQIAAPGPSSGSGNPVTYVDTTVAAGNTYTYRVRAVNGATASAYTNLASATVLAPPAAPTGFTVKLAASPATGYDLNWGLSANATNYTIQRATNATFTKGVTSETVTAPPVNRSPAKGTYYYRVRANNAYGSSAWTNGAPFPVQVP